jgi:16S rRNA (cytidine1402-2'-O)-methyltransferase
MGRLSIVATPIGNLEDLTLRALRTLKECDVIFAEDTRVISKLLAHYQIQKPLQRLDAAMEAKRAGQIIERIEGGEHVVYVSDAGTPGISDPGSRLVAAVRAAGHRIDAIPGASALTAALSIAGLDSPEFTFLGFLPHKKGRQTALKEIAVSERPVVLYESPHRILKLLSEIAGHMPERTITVAKEITKMHEAVYRGTAADVSERLVADKADRGEFVVIVGT